MSSDLGVALAESVDLHLGADVPTALLLSGGVDSAAVAAISRRLGQDLHCLTVCADGAPDETREAAQTARRYRHSFQRVQVALQDGDVARFFLAMQRPSVDGLNTYLICQAVRAAGFKVALSGLGGDEAVGGYSHFRILRYLRLLRAADRVPLPVDAVAGRLARVLGVAGEGKARRLLGKDGPRTGAGLALLQRELFPGTLVSELTGMASARISGRTNAARCPAGCSPTSFAAMAAAEAEIYLQAMLLPDADAFSMASSVELRVPFVDGHVFSAVLASAGARTRAPGKRVIAAALDDPYLKCPDGAAQARLQSAHGAVARRPAGTAGRGGQRTWRTGVVAGGPVQGSASRADILPRRRWAETWALTALNTWLETWAGNQAGNPT